jgi:hypothetical protein
LTFHRKSLFDISKLLLEDYNTLVFIDPELTALEVTGNFRVSSLLDDVSAAYKLVLTRDKDRYYLKKQKQISAVFPKGVITAEVQSLFPGMLSFQGDSIIFRGGPEDLSDFKNLVSEIKPPSQTRARLTVVLMDESLLKAWGFQWDNFLTLSLSGKTPSLESVLYQFKTTYSSTGSSHVFSSTADIDIDLVSGHDLVFSQGLETDRKVEQTVPGQNTEQPVYQTGFDVLKTGFSLTVKPTYIPSSNSWALGLKLSDAQPVSEIQRSAVALDQTAIFNGQPRLIASYSRDSTQLDKSYLPELAWYQSLASFFGWERQVSARVAVLVYLLPGRDAPEKPKPLQLPNP